MRIQSLNDCPERGDGEFVLYWMIAARRVRWNHALDHALERARALGRPLLIFEPLRCGYRWASDRVHRFIIDGMRDNALACARAGVSYLPHVEQRPGDSAGLLEALAARASLVVTDESPCFFLPRMVASAAARLDVSVVQVDSCGVLPLRATDRHFTTASSFRRCLQKKLLPHLLTPPDADPLADASDVAGADPAALIHRWPRASRDLLEGRVDLSAFPIDHDVPPVPFAGGSEAATARLEAFLNARLERYADARSHPDADVSSELSPYLHFGHISAHEIAQRVLDREDWSPPGIARKATGSRAGWWGLSEGAESFLDELITWRELGFVFCFHNPERYADYDTLPPWALKTLEAHAGDPRPTLYAMETLEAAETHDQLWNAAQRQLRVEGVIHNYLRMLWGKKIFEWSPTPQDALERLVHLNNKFAIDGRDPNSYSGVFWILGRFDRAWGPERPIYGKVRYMTSASARRKLRLDRYLETWGPPDEG